MAALMTLGFVLCIAAAVILALWRGEKEPDSN